MADTYSNPFAGLPNPQNYGNNPFMREYQTQERATQMQPFMDMERQRQTMGLQKQQMMNQEFMSPQAQATRMAGLQGAEAKSKFDVAKAQHDVSLLPEQRKAEVAKIANVIRSEEAKPFQEMFQELGGLADVLERTPEQHRPMVYKQWADRTTQKIGRPLPEQFQNYNPSILKEAQDIKYAQVFTPQHLQEIGKVKQQGENALAVSRSAGDNSARVARINQEGATERQGMVNEQGSPKNIAQIVYKMKNVLSDPNATPEAKETAKFQLESLATEKYYTLLQKATANDKNLLAIGGPTAEAAQRRIDRVERELKNSIFSSYGLEKAKEPKPDSSERVSVISPDGKVGTLPASQVEAAIKQGYKRQ